MTDAVRMRETPKTSEEILEEQIVQGLAELERPPGGLFLSGLSAGLDIGFSLLFMAVALTLLGPETPPAVSRIVLATMYSAGFIFVILGRSELFTEHTALAVFPVLDGRAGLRQLFRLWVVVYVANLIGAALFALFAVVLGSRLGVVAPTAFDELSRDLVHHDALTMLLSAVAAGWLMGLLSWLVSAAQETLARIALVWAVTAGMGLIGLHHCVGGTVEVLAGVFSGTGTTLADFGRFLLWATLGNTVGGVALVAFVKYSHSVRQ